MGPVGVLMRGGEQHPGNGDNFHTLKGQVTLVQKWELQGHRGIRVNPNDTVSLTAAKSHFLPPGSERTIMIPYKAEIVGGATIVNGLNRAGLMATLTVTKSGEMYLCVLNTLEESIHLIAKIVVINVLGADVWLKAFRSETKRLLLRKVLSANAEVGKANQKFHRMIAGEHLRGGGRPSQKGDVVDGITWQKYD